MDLKKLYKNITYDYIKLTLAINDVKSENFLKDVENFTLLMIKAGVFKYSINKHVKGIINLKKFRHILWFIETTIVKYGYANDIVKYVFRNKEDASKKYGEIETEYYWLELNKREIYGPWDEKSKYIWTVSQEWIVNGIDDIDTIIFINEEDAIEYFLKIIKTNKEYSGYTKENLFKNYAEANFEKERKFASFEILDYSYDDYDVDDHDSEEYKYIYDECSDYGYYVKYMNITIERFELL